MYEKPPMRISRGQFVRHAVQDLVSGNDIEDGQLRHAIRVIESHAVRNPPASIVSYDRKFLKSQTGHYFHLVPGHGALRIIQVVFTVCGFAAASVPRADRRQRR